MVSSFKFLLVYVVTSIFHSDPQIFGDHDMMIGQVNRFLEDKLLPRDDSTMHHFLVGDASLPYVCGSSAPGFDQ